MRESHVVGTGASGRCYNTVAFTRLFRGWVIARDTQEYKTSCDCVVGRDPSSGMNQCCQKDRSLASWHVDTHGIYRASPERVIVIASAAKCVFHNVDESLAGKKSILSHFRNLSEFQARVTTGAWITGESTIFFGICACSGRAAVMSNFRYSL